MAELNRADILNNTKWLGYCICNGIGIGPMSPLVAADTKQLCIHSTCSTADIGGDDGFCYVMENMCCVTEQCAFPPAKGTPPCICINKCKGPLIQAEAKEICCAGSTGMVPPVDDGIFCSSVETQLCFWRECQLPPSPSQEEMA